jgi:hypothetical protein
MMFTCSCRHSLKLRGLSLRDVCMQHIQGLNGGSASSSTGTPRDVTGRACCPIAFNLSRSSPTRALGARFSYSTDANGCAAAPSRAWFFLAPNVGKVSLFVSIARTDASQKMPAYTGSRRPSPRLHFRRYKSKSRYGVLRAKEAHAEKQSRTGLEGGHAGVCSSHSVGAQG